MWSRRGSSVRKSISPWLLMAELRWKGGNK
jgi:hypothetical protein